jgi:hypothetical protein
MRGSLVIGSFVLAVVEANVRDTPAFSLVRKSYFHDVGPKVYGHHLRDALKKLSSFYMVKMKR